MESKPGHNLHKPRFFVTGGQTGADDVPLRVYKECGVEVKGYMPKDFRRDDGNGREVAALHGLTEGEGGCVFWCFSHHLSTCSYTRRHAWRDKKNEEMSDALVAFLFDMPKTGKGTMQTLNKFKTGRYEFVPIQKTRGTHFTIVRGNKPSLVLWDVSDKNTEVLAKILRDFVNQYKPNSLMVAGSTAHTVPQVADWGAAVFKEVWGESNKDLVL